MAKIQEIAKTIYTKNKDVYGARLVVPNERLNLLVDEAIDDDDVLIDLIVDFSSMYPSIITHNTDRKMLEYAMKDIMLTRKFHVSDSILQMLPTFGYGRLSTIG